MEKIVSKIFLVCLVFNWLLYSQTKDDVKINVEANFDIRKISQTYFNEPNLWPYILIYNNISSLSNVKPGSVIYIPQKKVNSALIKLAEAAKQIESAVNYGAKVLAEDFLSKAIELNKEALSSKSSYNFDAVLKLASESIDYSKQAYNKTKEIRDKTIDAIISFKKGTVQKMFPSILKWQNAEEMENLKENDWARTLALSLAKITFFDLSQIKLSENSQAIIQRSRSDALNNKSSTKVTLEKGDAYAMLLNNPKKKFELDIKGVKTKINSKYFWVEKSGNGSKIANYNGQINIEVKDSTVVVQKNQGSVIPLDGPPSKPKDLLDSPQLLLPIDLKNLLTTVQEFTWSKVEGASYYWIDIARDKEFKSIYESRKNISGQSTTFNQFPKGVYYWRVCSVDSLGLPGPYSNYRYFVVSPDKNTPYLLIENPLNNTAVMESELKVFGKTDLWNQVFVNNVLTELNTEGTFNKTITLAEGINRIIFKAVNRGGIETQILRTVFYEPDNNIKILESKNGLIENGKTIYSEGSSVNLNFNTRPLSKIELKPVNNKFSRIAYADTAGNCSIVISALEQDNEFIISVTSPAGFQKNVKFNLIKEDLAPLIILDSKIEYVTNKDKIGLFGKVKNARDLFINNQKVEINRDSLFNYSHTLTSGVNIFEFKAQSPFGINTTIVKKVILDKIAPKLVSYSIQKLAGSISEYRIIAKGEDETGLKKTAVVEFFENSQLRKETLVFNEEQKVYEAVINAAGLKKPELKSITLFDYLLNSKTYEISK